MRKDFEGITKIETNLAPNKCSETISHKHTSNKQPDCGENQSD